MDPEMKRLLEETRALAKDNHRMLRSIRRGQWMSFFTTLIVWGAAIVVPLYLYQQYLSPIVLRVTSLPGISTTTASFLNSFPSSTELQNLINSFKGSQ